MSRKVLCLVAGISLSAFASTSICATEAAPTGRVHVAGWHAPAKIPAYTPAVVQTAPFAGAPNYVNRVPAFRWGWFGAETFPETCGWHRDAAGDWMYWSVQQRW